MKKFLVSLFAINEERISVLIVTFMVVLGFMLYVYVKTYTVDANMTNIILAFITAIAGVNLPQQISGILTNIRQYKNIDNNSLNENQNNLQG